MPDIPDFFHNGYTDKLFERELIKFAGLPVLVFCQIGAYSGDASKWLMENVLTHRSSVLYDVDTWEGGPDFDGSDIDFTEVERLYNERMSVFPEKIVKYKTTATDFFADAYRHDYRFDFIYIDGGHAAEEVLCNAVDAWRCLKTGGILAFDDYHWHNKDGDGPGRAIDAFMSVYFGWSLLEVGDQIWLEKVK